MATNTKNVGKSYGRSTLQVKQDLPELKRCGGRRRLSGPSQGDAAAKVDEDRRRGDGGGVRAQAVARGGRRVAEKPVGPAYL